MQDDLSRAVEVIVRFHNPALFEELSSALLSLMAQSWRPLRVLVVTQRFSDAQSQALEASLAPFRAIDPSVSLDVVRYTCEQGLVDARSALLNAGIAEARGRYLAVLDYDDVLYPEAYTVLVNALSASGSAVAFGGIALKSLAASTAVPFGIGFARLGRLPGQGVVDTFRAGFCPFHGMLLDRSRIAPADLRVDDSLELFEDYEWHLRLGALYPFSYHALDHIIGEYRYKDDGSNTVPLRLSVDAPRMAIWRDYGQEIERRRARLEITPAIQAGLGIDPPIEGLTIRGLLDRLDRGELTLPDPAPLPRRVLAYSSAEVGL
jgi:hypothetical protein